MRRYDSYKDSGFDWLGHTPTDWEVLRMCYVFRPISIKNTSGEINLSVYRDYGVIPTNSRSDNHNVISEDTSNYKLVEKGDFVMNKMKCWMGSLGLSDYRGIVSPSYTVMKPLKNNSHKYIHYLIRSKIYIPQYKRLSYGVREGQWDLRFEDFRELPCLIPPLSEQKQIVSFLDTKTSLIDSLIEKTERKIELLKEKRTSLINEVVTKGLNPKVEMKDSGVKWIGKIPSHWETTKFKFKGEVIIGLSYKPENQVDKNDGVLVMRSSNVQNGKPSFHDNVYVDCKISDKLRTREGDILICSRNGSRKLIGKNCLITKEIEGMSWGVFMTMYRTQYYKFFYWLLNSPVFKSQSGLFLTSTINQLTVSTLENMVVPYVSDKIEQKQIVEYLDKQTGIIDKTISIEEKRIELLKEYRQSLISEVVTGKRKVV